MDETVTKVLDPEFVFAAGDKELKLREPNGLQVRQAELLLAQGVNVESMRRYQIRLVALVAGVKDPEIEALPISHVNRAGAYLQAFIEADTDPVTDPEPEITITLDAPIVIENKGSFDQLTLREPTALQMRQAEALLARGVNVEAHRRYNFKLIADVARLALPIVELMPIRILNRGTAYLEGFIEAGPKTGAS